MDYTQYTDEDYTQYTDEAVLAAFYEDEAARYAGMAARPRRAHDGLSVASWEEPAGSAASLDSSEIDAARCELAGLLGLDATDVSAAMLSLSAGERDETSQLNALVALAGMTEGQVQEIALAAAKEPYGDVNYADPGYRGGQKRYPIDTAGHVRAAISYLSHEENAGQYTASQLAAMWEKVRAAAKRFGIHMEDSTGRRGKPSKAREPRQSLNGPHGGTDGSDSFGSGTGIDTGGPSGSDGASMTGRRLLVRDMSGNPHTVALTAEQEEEILGLSGKSEGGPVGEILARHPELFKNASGFVPSTRSYSPGKLGRRVQSGRALTPATDDEDPSDPRSHGEILRLLDQLGDDHFMRGKEKPVSGNRSYGPPSAAARRRGEQRQLAGGRPQDWG